MYCKKCGNNLPEGSAFCNKCGTPVIGSDLNSDPVPDTDIEISHRSLQGKEQGVYKERLISFCQKSSGKWTIIGIGAVILAFIIAMVVHNHSLRLMQLTIMDAVSQEIVVEKVDIDIRKGLNNCEGAIYKHITTEESGEIVSLKLLQGDYTLEVRCNGYITGYCQVNMKTGVASGDGDIVQEECYLVPQPKEDQLAVMLTWDDDNEDLDLIIYTSNEKENGYTSFIGSRMLSDTYGNYIISDNSSKYEVAYITKTDNHTIYINDYTAIQAENDSSKMADSSPRLCIYGTDGLLIACDYPAGKQGLMWKAVKCAGGNTIEINQLYSEAVGDEWWLRDKQKKMLIKKVGYNGEGNIISSQEHIYDAVGNETKSVYENGSSCESTYNEDGNEIQRILYNEEGDIAAKIDCTYDDYGVLVKSISYNSDGVLVLEDIYDEDGNVVKETSYGNDGNLEYWGEANYNSFGDITKAITYNSDGSIRRIEEHTYDSKGNLTKVYVHDEEQEIDAWTEMNYVYDENDNETEVILHDISGEIRRTEKSYNSDGNLINSISYNSQGIISSWYEYAYDAYGNRNIEIYKDSDGKKLSQTEYENEKEVKTIAYNSDGSVNYQIEYSYDEEGDVIRCTHYDGEGNIGYWEEYIYDGIFPLSSSEVISEESFETVEKSLTNISDGTYTISQIYYFGGSDGSYISADERFWVRASCLDVYGNPTEKYILIDILGNIYRIISADESLAGTPADMLLSLSENVIVECRYQKYSNIGDYNIIDISDCTEDSGGFVDVTDKYLGDNEKIIFVQSDDMGINYFTATVIDTYSYQDIVINVYDCNMKLKFTFSKSEMENQYEGFHWDSERLKIEYLGGCIYGILGDRQTLYIDTKRQKAFIQKSVMNNGYFMLSSNGEYILNTGGYSGDDYILIDIDGENIVYDGSIDVDYSYFGINNIWYPNHGPWSGFSEISEQFCYAYLSWSGDNYYALMNFETMDIIKYLVYEGSEITDYSDFYNGKSVLELENSGGAKFITILDSSGEWMFEPISGCIDDCVYYFDKIDKFMVSSSDLNSRYLIGDNGLEEQFGNIFAEDDSFFHIIKNDDGQYLIVCLDSMSGSLKYIGVQ